MVMNKYTYFTKLYDNSVKMIPQYHKKFMFLHGFKVKTILE